MTQPRGSFVWHELLTPNKESATAFYPRVVSWKTQAWDKAPNYTLWTGSRGPLGGLGTLPSEAGGSGPDTPMGWLPFVGVADAHKTVEQAKSLGARVITDVSRTPAGGEWAVISDPQGAVFAIYASTGEEGAEASAETPTGEFSWHELGTSNYKNALKFYSALFGWVLDHVHDMGEMGDYALFSVGGRQIGGMFDNLPQNGQAHPPSWMSYVRVDDVDSAVEAAVSAGGSVMMGPMDVPGGSRIAMMLDPDGMRFALHQAPRAAASAGKARKPAAAKKPAAAAKSAAAKKSPARKAAAKKAVAAKAPAAKASAKKAPAKKAPAKKAHAKKAPAKKAPAKKAPAGKSAGKKSASKVAPKKSVGRARPAAKSKASARPAAKQGAKKSGKTVRRAQSARSARRAPRGRASSRGRRGRR